MVATVEKATRRSPSTYNTPPSTYHIPLSTHSIPPSPVRKAPKRAGQVQKEPPKRAQKSRWKPLLQLKSSNQHVYSLLASVYFIFIKINVRIQRTVPLRGALKFNYWRRHKLFVRFAGWWGLLVTIRYTLSDSFKSSLIVSRFTVRITFTGRLSQMDKRMSRSHGKRSRE